MSFENFEKPINFMLEDSFSWVIKKDKFGSCSLSIVVDEGIKERVRELVTEHDTKDPFYKDTLYLKIKTISEKQKDLLNNGRCRVKVSFDVNGVFTSKDGVNHLMFKVKRVGKIKDEEVEDPPADL